MQKIVSSLILLLSVLSTSIFAQQGVHTSGGNASGTGGSVSYSVGQVFYESQNSSGGALIQGVQQPYELVVTEIARSESSLIRCEVFPNPAVREVNLKISGKMPEKANWKLIDLKGVTLLEGDVSQTETIIPMANQPMAAYTLQVLSGGKELNSFKVLKQ